MFTRSRHVPRDDDGDERSRLEHGDDGRHGHRGLHGELHHQSEQRRAARWRSTSRATPRPGGTAYAWNFGTGQGTGTGATTSHTYNTAGTYTVSLTVTYPTGDVTHTKVNYITVASGLCTVPTLTGQKRNDAQGIWTGAGFTGTVSDGPGAPNGNYTITTQSITAASTVPCNSAVVVNRP